MLFKSIRVLIGVFVLFQWSTSNLVAQSKDQGHVKQSIFPYQSKHVHASSIIELPNGDLLACWFEGSGERKANDVLIKASRLVKGASSWSKPFLLADTPGHPDCNPVLFVDSKQTLHLFWIVVQANRWENSIIKHRYSKHYNKKGAPEWDWQDVILLKPDSTFAQTIEQQFKQIPSRGLAWAEYAHPYERMIHQAAQDPKKRETGWMTRIHPIETEAGALILPLYSDGYNLSLMAISKDYGKTWQPSAPIVGIGNIQPSVVVKENGELVAFMRDNGDSPGKVMLSTSKDKGVHWSVAKKTNIPNPGTSVEVIKLKSKKWLLVYNNTSMGRNSLAVSISEDEGKTWPYTKTIEQHKNGSFSYPSVIQSKDGNIQLTYSYNLNDNKTIKHITFSEQWILQQ